MAEPVIVTSYQSTVLEEPEPGQGARKRSDGKTDSGSKSPGKSSRRWGKGALFRRSSSDQELPQKQSSVKGKARKEVSPDAQGDAHLDSSMDIGSRHTGPEATIVGVEGEDGERGKSGDAKKLHKQNKDLVKQVAQLNKTIDTLRHEKESLSVEKSKLKNDLKSAEKELKKVGSSLSSSRSEVEKLRHQHKLPKQSAGTAAEEMTELQKRVWQLEAQLTERNEKLANLRHKLGVQVERLENGSRHSPSPDAEEDLKGKELRTNQHHGSVENMLQLEQETNARLRKENSELQARVTSLEGDLEQLQQQVKDEERWWKKGKLFKKTTSSSSLKEHVGEGVIPTTFSADTIAGSDAYAELNARFSRQESPFSSPRNSPRLRRRNHMSMDGPTLQACLKLSLEEKKVLELEKEGLKVDLKNVRAQLEQLQETHSCEKEDLMEQLQKACTERDKVKERLKVLELQHNGTTSGQEWAGVKEAMEEENKGVKKDLEEVRQRSQQLQNGSSPPTAQQAMAPQLIHRRSASTTSEMSSEHKPATKRLSWSSESKDWRERKNSDSSVPIPERAANVLTSAEDSKVKSSTDAGYSREDKKSDGSSDRLLSSDKSKSSPSRRRPLSAEAEKGRSKESFAAARAKFLSSAGTSQSEQSSQKERSNSTSSMSDSTHTSTPSDSTSSESAARQPSVESKSQSTVVLGKPPIHPSTSKTAARRQSTGEGSSTPPPTASKAAALARRTAGKVAERRKSFEEQSGGPPPQSFQPHHARTTSSPAMSKLSTSMSVTAETETERQEHKLSAEVEKKSAQEKKAERERKWEEERKKELEKKEAEEREKKRKKEIEEKRKQELEEKRKRELEERERARKEEKERQRKEAEEKRKQEIEEKRRRELEEKERVRKEKEEKERQRKEMEEKRKQDLEEKRRRDLEEKERLRKEKEEKERQRKEIEERRKREQEEKKKRELEEKERLRKEKEEKERQRKMEMERKKQEELEKQRQLEERKKQEQERERELQKQREMERERERQREKEAALKRQREFEQQKKEEKERQEQMRKKQEEQERKKEEERKEEEREYPSGSVAQRRQAFEKNSPSSSPPVVLRKKIPGSPAQRPKSMDFSALQSVQVPTPATISPSPQNGSSKPTSISVTVSKSPQTSPLLNQRKEIKEVPVQKPIAKPNPPVTAVGRTSTVSIVTTSSSPPLRRAHTLSSSPAILSSLASSTPDLTSVGSTNGSSSPVREIQVGGWSPGSQRKTNSTAFRHSPLSQRRGSPVTTSPTEVRPPVSDWKNAPRSPLSEKKMTKSVSFSPVVSTAGGGMSVTKPSPPVTPQASMKPERLSFKASPAKLMIPGAADMKKAASLQDIPEHAPAHIVSQAPTFTVGVAPRVNRRPRSERPNTTSLSRADTVNLVNLISKMQGREKTQSQGNKGVSNGSSPTPQGGFSSPGRPASMYGSITPSRQESSPGNFSSQKPKPHERKLERRSTVASGLDRTSKKSLLLRWCRVITNDYDNIYIEDFSKSFSSGLAFCAIMHHFIPDKIPYSTLDATNRERNFRLAFEAAEEAGIPSLLDIEDMVSLPVPDWMSVMTYVSFIYNRFGQPGQKQPTLL